VDRRGSRRRRRRGPDVDPSAWIDSPALKPGSCAALRSESRSDLALCGSFPRGIRPVHARRANGPLRRRSRARCTPGVPTDRQTGPGMSEMHAGRAMCARPAPDPGHRRSLRTPGVHRPRRTRSPAYTACTDPGVHETRASPTPACTKRGRPRAPA
jgi:hypothetical protein